MLRIFFSLFVLCSQEAIAQGGFKEVVIKRDSVYETNNFKKDGAEIKDLYIDKGLYLAVCDSPYLVTMIAEKKNNVNDGLFFLFYLTTNMPAEKGSYIKGAKNGEWYYWDEKGKLVRTEIWKNDKLVSKKIMVNK